MILFKTVQMRVQLFLLVIGIRLFLVFITSGIYYLGICLNSENVQFFLSTIKRRHSKCRYTWILTFYTLFWRSTIYYIGVPYRLRYLLVKILRGEGV